ncbi:MAG TPA: nucleoside monophosphate kinase [Candidatus Saccharimonadales bacterium]|nr:nucleoside monophosphate kinase [Candidatus Saccharimonadales bacterium]
MIILYGPPGSGKSVQGQLLAARHNWRWLSTGQVLRDLHDPQIMREMEEKGIVNNKVVYRALIEALRKTSDVERVILDGFPRDLEQAHWLVAALPEHQRSIKAVVNISVPFEEVIRRLKVRGRFDDDEEIIRRRYNDYLGMSDEMVAFMQQERIPVVTVDGTGDVEDIHHYIDAELKKCLQK